MTYCQYNRPLDISERLLWGCAD